jgi:hypothetical protein
MIHSEIGPSRAKCGTDFFRIMLREAIMDQQSLISLLVS